MCFKSKSVERFKSVIEESYAFASDNIPLKEVGVEITNQSITRFLFSGCERKCLEKDCELGIYLLEGHEVDEPEETLQEMCFNGAGSTRNCSLYGSNERLLDHSSCTISSANKIKTRTETQAAIPLIQCLTEIMSTFGFWLGLLVSGSVMCVKKIGAQAISVRHKVQFRQRLTENLRPIHQQRKLLNQTITILQNRRNSNVRTRH